MEHYRRSPARIPPNLNPAKFHLEFYEGKIAFKVLHHDLYLGVHLFESTVHAHKEFGTAPLWV